MTLREWLEGDVFYNRPIRAEHIEKMSLKLGVNMDSYAYQTQKSSSGYGDGFIDLQLNSKGHLIITMFANKFGIDEEF